uniref:LytTR family DNA-binding domain-containing protein n=1 Tax=Staphylococcus arlettae TaxID=29378 RepID=UPI0021753B47|nr:LytTR family DNA-binding domain-containing protein [Staphylococcus arlettae]
MKIQVDYSEQMTHDELLITCNKHNHDIDKLLTLINDFYNQPSYQVRDLNNDIYFIAQHDIYSFRFENRLLKIYTLKGTFILNERLYKVKEHLASHFLQISKSEIINTMFIDHLVVNKNGIIEIIFTNNDSTYSSRRYLKSIKEALKL